MDSGNRSEITGKMKPFYRVIRFILVWFFRPFFRLRIEGIENIPKSGPFILASNHKSNFDVIFLATGVKKLQLWAMAKAELFKIPVLGWILKGIGAYPVNRGGADMSALDAAIDIIKKGRVAFLFPEGHRAKGAELQKPQSGVGLLCFETKADVLPVSIYFEGKIHIFSKVVLRFGEIIPNEEFHFSEKLKSKERKAAAQLIMDKIGDLYERKFT